jgi:hypothetical protein
MNENLNLIEILKNCPIGTKFYSSYLGKDVFFIGIYYNCIKCEYTSQIDSLNSIIQFRKDGSLYIGGECMLFPSKDQRDWSKWHRPFVDGDVIVRGDYIGLYETYRKGNIITHCSIDENLNFILGEVYYCFGVERLATEEEKQKLFDAIKANGYEWNSETKTLKELKKEKFDPKTLQPFDKVLVRDFNNQKWMACLFSHIDNNVHHQFRTVDRTGWYHCIPFNDDTKHLVGKSDEAPEFYKYWKE